MSLWGLYLERLIFGILRYLILSYLQNILRAFPRQFQFLINRPPYLNSLIIYVLMLSMFFFFTPHVPPTRHYTMYDRNRLQGVFTQVASTYANSLEEKKLFT